MFRRFWPKIRVYGNHHHRCSFKATINWRIRNDVESVGPQNCLVTNLGFSKSWKFENFQNFIHFLFLFHIFHPLHQFFFSKKPYNMLEGNGWWICVQNCKLISSKMAEIWHKTCQKQILFTSFRDFTVISRISFCDRFDASNSVLGPFFAFFAKIWPKNMYYSSKSHFFLWPFLPGDLRWPWPVLWTQNTGNDTYKCQWYYPCRFIGFVCA